MTIRILTGDCRDVLLTLPAGSVHCVVTSPPYFGLRDYGHAGQIGLEPTPDQFVAALVGVMREVWRVLREDGVCWINLGDSFAGSPGSGGSAFGPQNVPHKSGQENARRAPGVRSLGAGNLLGIPWRVALALQADGWTLRQAVTWAKVAPMPESVAGTRWERCRMKVAASGWSGRGVRDNGEYPKTGSGGYSEMTDGRATWADCPGCPRCAATDGYVLRRGSWRHTMATEMVFMLTRGMSYWADQESAREPAVRDASGNVERKVATNGERSRINTHMGSSIPWVNDGTGRNPRNWVTPSPSPFPGAHFATFPPSLIEPFIRATCPARACPTCGAGWAPVVERESTCEDRKANGGGGACNWWVSDTAHNNGHAPGMSYDLTGRSTVLGYRPTCACPPAAPVPGVVLDPFLGAGTTALVADRLGRDCIGIELNPEYAAMADARIRADAGMFAEVLR